jgi:hypothetical protein
MPTKLANFIGQDALKELIHAKIRYARANESSLPHLLLCGQKESGKKRFAGAIADELSVTLTSVESSRLIKSFDLNGLFTNLAHNAVLMISNIELLRDFLLDHLVRTVSGGGVEILIGAGPGARRHMIEIPPFTFIGTTSKPWMVDERLRRWCILCEFVPYSSDEVVRIVSQVAIEEGLSLTHDAAECVAEQSKGNLGDATMLLRKIANHLRPSHSTMIDHARLRQLNEFLGSGSSYPQSLALADDLQKMEGIEFEYWVADLFRKAGFRVEVTQASGDHGVDLWATIGTDLVAVQCKRWEGTVGEPVLRDLYGAMTAAGAKAGYLVTTGTFTAQAHEFARSKALILVDLSKLIEATKVPLILPEMLTLSK